jgi:DNA-binding NarL/FixJ family response regulator
MTDAAIWQVNLLGELGRPRDAAKLASDAFEEGLALGSPAWSYFLAGMSAEIGLDLGDWEAARRLIRAGLAARQPGIPGAMVRLAAAQHAVLVGELVEARLHVERALELVPERFAGLHFAITRVLTGLLIAEGDPEGALEWILARQDHSTQDIGGRVRYHAWTAWAMAEVAEGARDRGDTAALERVCARLEGMAAEPSAVSHPEEWRFVRFAEAEGARCRRSPDEEARWEVAAAAAHDAETPWHEAYALWRQVQAGLRAHAPRAQLAEPLREAHRIASRLGARPLQEQVEFLATSARIGLGAVEVAEQRAGGDGLLGTLTGRERQVLDHLVAGRSNAEVARLLVISEKTVSVHVSNILRKTRTSSRVEAAELARRHR